MRTSAFRLFFIVLTVVSARAHAGRLPGALTSGDVKAITQRLAFPLATKVLRSAEALPTWPGFKIGLEGAASFPGGVANLGDGTGVKESATFLPRFYAAKGLFAGVEAAVALAPSESPTGNGCVGASGKITWLDERDGPWSSAFYGAYTYLDLFRGDFSGHTGEFGMVWSRDFVRLRPFLGVGALYAQGTVRSGLVLPGENQTSRRPAAHAFVGLEVEYPANLTLQLDFYNEHPAASLFLGQRF